MDIRWSDPTVTVAHVVGRNSREQAAANERLRIAFDDAWARIDHNELLSAHPCRAAGLLVAFDEQLRSAWLELQAAFKLSLAESMAVIGGLVICKQTDVNR